jgi:hypothetical protein
LVGEKLSLKIATPIVMLSQAGDRQDIFEKFLGIGTRERTKRNNVRIIAALERFLKSGKHVLKSLDSLYFFRNLTIEFVQRCVL